MIVAQHRSGEVAGRRGRPDTYRGCATNRRRRSPRADGPGVPNRYPVTRHVFLWTQCHQAWRAATRCFGGAEACGGRITWRSMMNRLIGVGERSGRSRPYVRPVARCLPLAMMGVRSRVRHQSGGRARGTNFCTVSPELFRSQSFPHAGRRLPPDRSGSRPTPTISRGTVTPRLPPRPRSGPSPGRPLRASSTPRRCAPFCSPAPPSPA